jgi:hypothetical protein
LQHFYYIAYQALRLDYGEYDYGFNLKRALEVNYGEYGLGAPNILWQIATSHHDFAGWLISGVAGLLTLAYIVRNVPLYDLTSISQVRWLGCVAVGFAGFVLGYSIFHQPQHSIYYYRDRKPYSDGRGGWSGDIVRRRFRLSECLLAIGSTAVCYIGLTLRPSDLLQYRNQQHAGWLLGRSVPERAKCLG